MENVKHAAIQAALSQNGNADLLVNAEYSITQRGSFSFARLFKGAVKTITVTGRPAYYKNFRPLNDNVFCDPIYMKYNGEKKVEKLSSFSLFRGSAKD